MTLPTVVMSEEGTLAKKFLSQTVNMFVCCQVGCFKSVYIQLIRWPFKANDCSYWSDLETLSSVTTFTN